MTHKIAGNYPCERLGMDQSPILNLYNESKMFERKGTKIIHVDASTTDSKKVLLVFTFFHKQNAKKWEDWILEGEGSAK